MNDIAIRVENLGKQFYIGGIQQKYDRFGEQFAAALTAPARRAAKLLRGQATGAAELDETLWALANVSFEIQRGEVVGIIGRNGAGKSTLLKILSRITEPSAGWAEIHGRVGSLLEVGTGFHPELTGRENVYLNGAILGMRKQEIQRKLDEIIAFAEIERFVETPVKHYSSGMYVRLAFSVAAHLEPEILLVDEVLAVGDVAFQKKCLGKMEDVAHQGRTVLFVSHNMGMIQNLCDRGILIAQGCVAKDGPIVETVTAYVRTLEQAQTRNLAERTDREGSGRARLIGVDIVNGKDEVSTVLKTGEPARFEFHLSDLIPGLSCMFTVFDQLGQRVAMFGSDIRGPQDSSDVKGGNRFVCEIDRLLLLPGRYYINVLLRDNGGRQDRVEAAAIFDVESGLLDGRPTKFLRNGVRVGIPHRWISPA